MWYKDSNALKLNLRAIYTKHKGKTIATLQILNLESFSINMTSFVYKTWNDTAMKGFQRRQKFRQILTAYKLVTEICADKRFSANIDIHWLDGLQDIQMSFIIFF